MRVESRSATISTDDGAVQIAFDLSGSDAAYLLLSVPANAKMAEEEFFGQDHYVEVKDQRFGRYGGIKALHVEDERRLRVEFSYEVPGVGTSLEIIAHEPMRETLRAHLQQFQRA